jgi:hypothetical protein
MVQVVDTETAKEFMQETLAVVDVDELAKISTDVQAKSDWFRQKLNREVLPELSNEDYETILERIFSTRGKTRKALAGLDIEDVRTQLSELLYGADRIESRFEAFVEDLDGMAQNLRADFASELLHFTDPDQYWLWTRWMWDPRTKTGSLPLVTSAVYDLQGESPGETYMKVGRAVAFVHEVGDGAGFWKISRSIFGTDVFLSCVYVIYTYTVLRMRMTKEFNKVIPGLPEFSRRLLGVYS